MDHCHSASGQRLQVSQQGSIYVGIIVWGGGGSSGKDIAQDIRLGRHGAENFKLQITRDTL